MGRHTMGRRENDLDEANFVSYVRKLAGKFRRRQRNDMLKGKYDVVDGPDGESDGQGISCDVCNTEKDFRSMKYYMEGYRFAYKLLSTPNYTQDQNKEMMKGYYDQLINGEMGLFYNGSDAYPEHTNEFKRVKKEMQTVLTDMVEKSKAPSRIAFNRGFTRGLQAHNPNPE